MYNIKQHTQYYIRLVFSKEENNTTNNKSME